MGLPNDAGENSLAGRPTFGREGRGESEAPGILAPLIDHPVYEPVG